MQGHSTDDSVMQAATLAQPNMHPSDAMSNTDTNSVFLGQFRYATEYICPFWTFRPDNLFVQATTLRSNTSSYLPAVSAGYQGRPPPHSGSRKAPTYTVRVRCAFVFVVTQPDSLPFCPRHGGYYGKVRHHLFSTVLHRSNQTQVNCVTYCPGSLSRSLAIGSPKIPQCTRGPQQPCERKKRAFQITISKGRPEEQL
jgi:hypothetical protein